MGDKHYPYVVTEFIIDKLLESDKVIKDSQLKIGSTITFILNTEKPLHKRTITIREFNGEINFMQATGLAIIYGFMGDLLNWYEEHKSWKEGGYVKQK
jgi:hypothetical protein